MLREEAEFLRAEAAHDMCEADKAARQAQTRFKLAMLLHDAKMRRIEAYERKKSRYKPFRHMERIYQAAEELSEARYEWSEAWRLAAEAECRSHATLTNVKTLEIARLKRELRRRRRCKKSTSCVAGAS